ncbi:MAG: baseplate J/gp47 family protein [Candidatus Omnitrophica bacterium]|jgi:uncharacterized phage protein gp47/JayE|nr:baseplate J/gp47 family protein [Candidatus Omnitrophota bacterium]
MATRRSYINIVEDGRTRLEQNSPVNNFNQQGISKAFLDILGVEVEKQYDNLEYVYRAIDPTKATGSDLEKIGYLVGEYRTEAVTPSDYSTTNFYFYIDPKINMSLSSMIKRSYTYEERNTLVSNGFLTNDIYGEPQNLIIPIDTVVQNFDGTISYTTINSVILNNTDSYVGIIATNTGPSYNVETNTLIAHTLHQIPELRKISQYIKCSNRFPIQNGKYSINDDELRYKISTSRSSIRSNELSIRRSALSVPGVRDILFEKNKYGAGTVNIIIDGVSPLISQGLIDAVKEKVQQEQSYGDTIYVNRPEYIGIELDIGIVITLGTIDELSVKQLVKSSIIQYINDLPIGGEIIWNRIIDVVMDVSGVEDIVPRTFKLGEYDIFHKLIKNQIILQFQNQKASLTQKFFCDYGLCNICIV